MTEEWNTGGRTGVTERGAKHSLIGTVNAGSVQSRGCRTPAEKKKGDVTEQRKNKEKRGLKKERSVEKG